MKRLKEQVKELYGEFSLSEEQLRALKALEGGNPSEASAEYYRVRAESFRVSFAVATRAGALALAALLLFYFLPLPGATNEAEKFASEIAYHYNKQMALELESSSFDEIKSFFHKLDFSLIKSSKLPEQDWKLLGGRYCTVKGVLGAQLRVQRKLNGKIYTVYQAIFPEDLGNISGTFATYQEGVKVELWKERGLLLALTGED